MEIFKAITFLQKFSFTNYESIRFRISRNSEINVHCVIELVNYLISYIIIFIVLILTVADKETKERLAEYRLPVTHLQPYHHYHLEMVLVRLKLRLII